MFRPYKAILRPSKKTDPKAVNVFLSRSVITYKYNMSVDNATLYLYTKIVYFVRVACFDLIFVFLEDLRMTL